MTSTISRDEALKLLRKYNKEPFHIQHGITVEKTMRWFARELNDLFDKTLRAMQSCESEIGKEMDKIEE